MYSSATLHGEPAPEVCTVRRCQPSVFPTSFQNIFFCATQPPNREGDPWSCPKSAPVDPGLGGMGVYACHSYVSCWIIPSVSLAQCVLVM